MKKSKNTLVIVIVLAGIVALLIFFSGGESKLKYRWDESYDVKSDQPYGTLFIQKLLEEQTTGKFSINDKKPLRDLLVTSDTLEDYTYILVGQSLYLDEQDLDAMLAFVSDGNDAFIATLDEPYLVLEKIACQGLINYSTSQSDSARLNFYDSTLSTSDGYEFQYRYGTEDVPYYWSSIEVFECSDGSESPDYVALGYQQDRESNFIKLSYGDGHLYIHSTPIAFTNYFMINENKAEYASKIFSHVPLNNVVWDEFSKVPFYKNPNKYNSPLYYILQQPSLKYAWWLFLLTVVLYVFFAAKRTQRNIPVLETKSNTSLEFVRMVSSLHYMNGTNIDMAKKKMKYFFYFIRSKYGIHELAFTPEVIAKLAEKSKVDIKLVENIFHQYSRIEAANYEILPQGLQDLYDAIENFYKHCK